MIGRTVNGFIAIEPARSPHELAWERLRPSLAVDERSSTQLVPVERIAKHIVVLRGEKVMLDADLAALYGVETKALNQAVQRNVDRFPADFMFRLDAEEVAALKSQRVTSNPGRGGRRTAPYAFTEQGVAMLSSVLRSDRAVQVNIAIVRAFVSMRRLIGSHAQLAKRLDDLEAKYDGQFRAVFDVLRRLTSEPDPGQAKPPIGFLTEAGITRAKSKGARGKARRRAPSAPTRSPPP